MVKECNANNVKYITQKHVKQDPYHPIVLLTGVQKIPSQQQKIQFVSGCECTIIHYHSLKST